MFYCAHYPLIHLHSHYLASWNILPWKPLEIIRDICLRWGFYFTLQLYCPAGLGSTPFAKAAKTNHHKPAVSLQSGGTRLFDFDPKPDLWVSHKTLRPIGPRLPALMKSYAIPSSRLRMTCRSPHSPNTLSRASWDNTGSFELAALCLHFSIEALRDSVQNLAERWEGVGGVNNDVGVAHQKGRAGEIRCA